MKRPHSSRKICKRVGENPRGTGGRGFQCLNHDFKVTFEEFHNQPYSVAEAHQIEGQNFFIHEQKK